MPAPNIFTGRVSDNPPSSRSTPSNPVSPPVPNFIEAPISTPPAEED